MLVYSQLFFKTTNVTRILRWSPVILLLYNLPLSVGENDEMLLLWLFYLTWQKESADVIKITDQLTLSLSEGSEMVMSQVQSAKNSAFEREGLHGKEYG